MGLYRAWLHWYPASFRAEYGEEMCAVFARRQRDAEGPPARLALCVETFFETLVNAAAVHADILRQDLRYVARTLRASPGFTLTAILILALGIGANTAAFSIADHVLVRALPFRDPDRLVKLWERVPSYNRLELSPPNFRDWKGKSTVFESMTAIRGLAATMVGVGDPQLLTGASATADLFATLGVQPEIGRPFSAADDQENAPATVLISHHLWQTEFAADPAVLGRTIRLDDVPSTIIGVMPPGFLFPSRDAEIWTPMRFSVHDFEDRTNYFLQAIARLKPEVSLETARAEMRLVAARLEQAYPKENKDTGATVIGLRDELSENTRLLLLGLCGAALCVLLIACTNLGNLLLARAIARRKELAVRAALGAGSERLVRQLLTESLVLSLLGGALGVLLAFSLIPLLVRLVPNGLPIAERPSIDLRVLGFAAFLSGLTGVAFGLLPAWWVCRRADLSSLREGARTGDRKERLRSLLAVAEIAATVVLLVSSGLLVRALWKLQASDPGFRSAGVLTLRTVLPMPKFQTLASRLAIYERILPAVRALPGVSGAAYISFIPMRMTGGIWPVGVNGRLPRPASPDNASLRFVTPEFFSTLRIPVRQGRDVRESDSLQQPFAAVVSESFARRYWPNQDPLGRHFQVAFHDRTVIGVVGDIRVRGLERQSEPQVYLPYRQQPDQELPWYSPKDLVVRTAASPASLVPTIRRLVAQADPAQPVSDVATMEDIIGAQTEARSVQALTLSAFAALAFLLAAIGLHGVLSFAVSQRAREIGVRRALGARSGDILGMVLRHGAVLAGAGVIPGLVLAYLAARTMQTLLAGIEPGDARTFLSAAALSLAMTLAGSLLPALRALRVDPITVIRAE